MLKHVGDNNVDISSQQEKQKSVVPSCLEEALILATLEDGQCMMALLRSLIKQCSLSG